MGAMIPLSDISWQTQSWQHLLQSAISDPEELGRRLGLALPQVHNEFPLRVPLPYLSRIRPGDPDDPLLLQVLAQPAEMLPQPGYSKDPLAEVSGDQAHGIDPHASTGLIQKYHGRVLIVTTGACAIHCRYCFRRHFPYSQVQPSQADWQQILDTVRADTSIHEVILSGGDPLLLNDRQLASLAHQIADIGHVKTLRLHTRLPIVIPQRINAALLDWIAAVPLKVVMVWHSNHPNELDDEVAEAAAKLTNAGVTLLNQSVLLRNINDSVEILVRLSESLFAIGVLPYYLHLLDPVSGAAHFDVDDAAGGALINAMRARLPGYLVPRLARETPGETSKTLVM